MRILIIAPVPAESTRGNRITAVRWANLLQESGHDVQLAREYQSGDFDCLIALHARHSRPSLIRFHQAIPDARIVVCLTGTDLHIDFDPVNRRSKDSQRLTHYKAVQQSLDLADQIILLEPVGQRKLPAHLHSKCHVIRQSAEVVADPPPLPEDYFLVTVVGHLRPVKDPFRTAAAARLLPPESRIRIVHIGNALSSEMETAAKAESDNNERYEWIGGVSHDEAMRKLASSHLTVLTSLHEGAPSVISEAIVNRVPVLATKIDATIGMLGADYPGLFEVGDTQRLAELMLQVETEPEFLQQLREAVNDLAPQFSINRELNAWKSVLNSRSVQ